MSQRTGQDGERGPPGASHQPEVHWDLSRASSHVCDVANSTAGPDDVVLNFGATQRGGEGSAEVSVRMQRRITLRPLTARNLQDMLRSVIADIDADKPRGAV
jgi:hypothetical protein